METVTFLVQGSAAEPYKVTFKKDGSNLSAYCSCPAGENGLYCKHRVGILSGETKGIASGNEGDFPKVTSWLPGTEVEKAMKDVIFWDERLS